MIARTLLASLALLAQVNAVHAAPGADDSYPNKPIKIIVGYSPGGSTDIVARVLARRLQDSLGQPVVVENRPSTGAILGAVVASKAKPDGYTLMIGASGPMVINPATYSRLPYAPDKDFMPISLVASFPLIVTVKGDSKLGTIADLVKATQSDPNGSNYAASATAFQLASELLKERTGIVAEHVPYKGSAESGQSVAAGQTTFTMLDPGPAAGAIKGKLLKGLAVTSDKRMALYPAVPTLKELGVDLEVRFWLGLFAPAGTPAAIVQLLERETAKAVAHPDVVSSLDQLGLEPTASTSADFGRQITREIQSWTALAKAKKIKAD